MKFFTSTLFTTVVAVLTTLPSVVVSIPNLWKDKCDNISNKCEQAISNLSQARLTKSCKSQKTNIKKKEQHVTKFCNNFIRLDCSQFVEINVPKISIDEWKLLDKEFEVPKIPIDEWKLASPPTDTPSTIATQTAPPVWIDAPVASPHTPTAPPVWIYAPVSLHCAELCYEQWKKQHNRIPVGITGIEIINLVTSYMSSFDDLNTKALYGNNINCWDTSLVEDFGSAFSGQTTFNEHLDCWDVSSGTNFGQMFDGASTFDQNIVEWNVGSGTNFEYMFYGAKAFDQNIEEWKVGSGTNFEYMFHGAEAFDQDLCGWNFQSLTPGGTDFMFDKSGCKSELYPSDGYAVCHNCVRRLGTSSSNNNNNNNDNNINDNNNRHNEHILQEGGIKTGAGAETENDIIVFTPSEMVDNNIHPANNEDSSVTFQQTNRRW